MHLTKGETKGNGREARRLYEQRFPTRRIPSHPTFCSAGRRMRETGLIAISNRNAVRLRNSRISQVRERWHTKWVFLIQWCDVLCTRNACPSTTCRECNLCTQMIIAGRFCAVNAADEE
ncbi:hypothetical protein TNCT_292281 [Trichonephila clavata]|uniref:DUF4817 domain-containing protein n=1 Tax=Trichonephila clavata TaxID=2740835 RepID=A0A8X6FTP0_TRICU|nr:hypothetical protein TNCT_292281 [Trichonephila clavata]